MRSCRERRRVNQDPETIEKVRHPFYVDVFTCREMFTYRRGWQLYFLQCNLLLEVLMLDASIISPTHFHRDVDAKQGEHHDD